MRKLHYLAVGVAACGLLLVIEPWQLHLDSMKSALLGIASGICWDQRHHRQADVPATPVDLMSLTTWQMIYATLVMAMVAALVPERPIDWQPYVFGALAYSAIFATALAWSLWLFVLKKLPAGIAGLSTLAVPVSGVLLSWWLLGENPGPVEGGIGLIVLALIVISRKGKRSVVSVAGIPASSRAELIAGNEIRRARHQGGPFLLAMSQLRVAWGAPAPHASNVRYSLPPIALQHPSPT